MNRVKYKTVLSFLASLAFCFLLVGITVLNRNNTENHAMETLIMEKSMKISDVISKLLYKTEAISALVTQSNGNVGNFEQMAAAITDDPSILNILIAPSGIVSDVYPLQGNEAVIGLDFFSEGDGNMEALMARDSGELVFGGPFSLVQGGQALVGRLPIYTNSSSGDKEFWGLVSVTLKYPEVLYAVGLDEIEEDGLSYIIWRINPDNNEKQIIASGENYNNKHTRYVERQINILNAEWYFCLTPVRSWYEYSEVWLLIAIGLCISFLIAFVVQNNMDLKTAKKELKNKVSETKLLAGELENAKKQVKQAEHTRHSFLANMNHEIRTPMSGIIGFAELAADNDIDPEIIRDYLDKIKNSADGLMGIIDDILDITKIESGVIKLEKQPFSIYEMLTLCGAVSNLNAAEKGLNLSVSMGAPVTKKVMGDPSKLRQILLNLLSNAVKFTDRGCVELTASARNINENELTVKFEVKDSGIGMSPEQVKHIFEPFVQADNTLTRQYGGPGLGLTIARSLLELMGSELMVESSLGTGSIFSFTLTFETVDDLAEIPENRTPTSGNPIFDGDVLVCEDNDTNQMVIEGHLQKMGLDVTIAPDGKTGVELAQSRMMNGNPFDLIFMDIHMPVMDGLQAATRLSEIGSSTPIIALTANIMDSDLEIYKKHGMEISLGKPFKAQALRECLLKYLTPARYSSATGPDGIKRAHPQNGPFEKKCVIDKKTGLDQYDGDEKTYNSILDTFSKNNKNTLKDLKNSIETGDVKLAHRIAHSLRGASGTIGATRLADAAFSVENTLSTTSDAAFIGGKAFDGQIKLLESEFEDVYDELKDLVTDSKEKVRKTNSIDSEKAFEVINELTVLLETGDSKSLEYMDEIEDIFRNVSEKCKLFLTQMEQYDFELAYDTLQSIRQFTK